ncbi:MAG TPA: TPM domain-containing protein [Cyclobacteriaceae bacterium]|nr:TPM domain-containing protein [Cyclobacteriaceae bacterium]
MKYTERNPLAGDDLLQEGIRFQYRLDRELKRTCPNYPNGRVRLLPKLVYDLEDKLKKQQIDSLDILTALVNKDKGAYLYIVTIDEFFPESTITDFSNRYRDYWVPKTLPEKGAILIVVSVTQRQVRISTGDKSMTHLTDKECDEVIKVMIQHFKLDKYFDGLVDGVKAIKSKL